MSTSDPGVRLVVFDLGRVLVRICDDWQHACRCAGLEINAAALLLHAARLKQLSDAHEVGEIDSGQFFAEIARLMGAEPVHVRSASEAYTQGGFPGAVELVDELNASGIPTACLTNTNPHHWNLLSQSGHLTYFPLNRLKHRFASHLVRFRKPDDAIYQHVEKETGASPGSILFFDDVMENVDAAARRGWRVHRVDPKLENPVPHLREVLWEKGVLR
jgi:putative hydrolase of the HAD superfamily